MELLARAEKGAGSIDLKNDKRLPKVQTALAKRGLTPDLSRAWTKQMKKKSEVMVGWASDDLAEDNSPNKWLLVAIYPRDSVYHVKDDAPARWWGVGDENRIDEMLLAPPAKPKPPNDRGITYLPQFEQ